MKKQSKWQLEKEKALKELANEGKKIEYYVDFESVTVEAKSEEEACEIGQKMMDNGEIRVCEVSKV